MHAHGRRPERPPPRVAGVRRACAAGTAAPRMTTAALLLIQGSAGGEQGAPHQHQTSTATPRAHLHRPDVGRLDAVVAGLGVVPVAGGGFEQDVVAHGGWAGLGPRLLQRRSGQGAAAGGGSAGGDCWEVPLAVGRGCSAGLLATGREHRRLRQHARAGLPAGTGSPGGGVRWQCAARWPHPCCAARTPAWRSPMQADRNAAGTASGLGSAAGNARLHEQAPEQPAPCSRALLLPTAPVRALLLAISLHTGQQREAVRRSRSRPPQPRSNELLEPAGSLGEARRP